MFFIFSGYMAPEYAMHGYLTEKADVYSFGIVALEIVSGRSNTSYKLKGECLYLLSWVIDYSYSIFFSLFIEKVSVGLRLYFQGRKVTHMEQSIPEKLQ